MSGTISDEIIELKGSGRISSTALKLALKLESLGVRIEVGEKGGVSLFPSHLVPVGDIPALRQHKADLATIARYRADAP